MCGRGSRVLIYRIAIAYNVNASDAPVFNRLHEIIAAYSGLLQDLMAFYGAGDNGGRPTVP